MLVREIMSTDLVTVDHEGRLDDVAGAMVENRVGSVIVVGDEQPLGIVTETDVMLAGLLAGERFAAISVVDAMSSPLVTVSPDETVRAAAERMKTEEVKKLPVADGLDLVSIVTMTDVVYHETDLIEEAHRRAERREEWESDRLFR